MNNQAWFDATLVYRLNKLSSVFIRSMKALDRSVETFIKSVNQSSIKPCLTLFIFASSSGVTTFQNPNLRHVVYGDENQSPNTNKIF